MDYITTVQASLLWGISPRRITVLAKAGRIPFAVQVGTRWMIPQDAKKPIDGRTKALKTRDKVQSDEIAFSLLFGNCVIPTDYRLSQEELQLKHASNAFFACNFEEAHALMGNLPQTATNRYVRIAALQHSCMIAFVLNKMGMFYANYNRLLAELQEDFPHKKEISALLWELNATLGFSDDLVNGVSNLHTRHCHPDFLPHIAALSTISMFLSEHKSFSAQTLVAYEMMCSFLDRSNLSPLDVQTMHLYLGLICETFDDLEKTQQHFCRVFDLAVKHDLYWQPASLYYYFGTSFDAALCYFPSNLIKKIKGLSDTIHQRYLSFKDEMSSNAIFELIPQNKLIYAVYAVQDYTNKEIAKFLHKSEKTIEKNYASIYETLNISSKAELVEFYQKSVKKHIPSAE